MYERTTHNICVRVQPVFLGDVSDTKHHQFLWAYHITIKNLSETAMQLTHRQWYITDTLGAVQEVTGEGVVGQQPTILSQETFEYTSSVSLSTPSGIMVGYYTMQAKTGDTDGTDFIIHIPLSLDNPDEKQSLH